MGHYIGLVFYDVDGLQVTADTHMYYSGGGSTLTTLAADLNPGDTTVQITDATNRDKGGSGREWRRRFIFWDHESATGVQYAAETYSRNRSQTDAWLVSGDWSGNTVTLNPAKYPSGWDGALIPAGTQLSQAESGSTYKYIAGSNYDTGDTDWHRVSGQIGGLDLSGLNVADEFPPGAAYAKVLVLPNWTGTPTDLHLEAVSLIEVDVTEEGLRELLLSLPSGGAIASGDQVIVERGGALYRVTY